MKKNKNEIKVWLKGKILDGKIIEVINTGYGGDENGNTIITNRKYIVELSTGEVVKMYDVYNQ